MKNRTHSLARNIATNTSSFLITLTAAFLMFPVMIHKLGAVRYGLWMLVAELTGYFVYLGLGVRAGVVYHAALRLVHNDRQGLNEILSTAFWSLTALGSFVAVASFGLIEIFPHLFTVDAADLRETALSIGIMAIAVGLSLPLEAMNSGLTAAKRLEAR